jgi:hypothetical protein
MPVLRSIPAGGLVGVKVAAFDPRLPMSAIQEEPRVLAFFVRLFGYAAKPVSEGLRKKGGTTALPPEWFYGEGVEGPLNEGELERAADWAGRLVAAYGLGASSQSNPVSANRGMRKALLFSVLAFAGAVTHCANGPRGEWRAVRLLDASTGGKGKCWV